VAAVSSFTASGNSFTINTADGNSFTANLQLAAALTTGNLSQFAATTSAQLAGVISDETGSGNLVFGTSPAITTSLTTPSASFDLVNTNATTVNFAGAGTTVNIGALTGNTTVRNNMVVTGNLLVSGTTTTISATTLDIADKNITLAKGSGSGAAADGAGITIEGANATFNYVNATTALTSSQDLDLAAAKVYKISGTSVLSNTTLGTGVVNSSLTSVGTISGGTWQGNAIATTYTAAKIVSVTNTAPISAITTAGAVTVSLLNSGVTANTYGGTLSVPVITVDAFGRITSASNVTISTGVSSVGGATGTVSNAQLAASIVSTGVLNTSNVAEGGNLYYTNARVRSAISLTGTKGNYNSSTGVFDLANIANVTVSVNPPGGPNIGDIWIDEDDGKTYLYFNDNTSSQWVEQATGTVISTLITSVAGSTGDISNAMIATGLSGQNLGTPSGIVLTNATGTAANLTANIANFINVTDDTTTNATRYPIFANGTSGNITEQVSSSKLTFNPSTGLLTSTDYNSSSDKRLKKKIKTVGSALDKINALRGVTFTWKDSNTDSIGMIAQEVQEVLPEVVTTDDDGFMGIKYTNMIGVLIEAIKELKADFEEYKKTHP
jgi:hypothetical protein